MTATYREIDRRVLFDYGISGADGGGSYWDVDVFVEFPPDALRPHPPCARASTCPDSSPVRPVSSRACLRGLRVLSQSVALDVGGNVLLLLFWETVLQRSTHWKRSATSRRWRSLRNDRVNAASWVMVGTLLSSRDSSIFCMHLLREFYFAKNISIVKFMRRERRGLSWRDNEWIERVLIEGNRTFAFWLSKFNLNFMHILTRILFNYDKII